MEKPTRQNEEVLVGHHEEHFHDVESEWLNAFKRIYANCFNWSLLQHQAIREL